MKKLIISIQNWLVLQLKNTAIRYVLDVILAIIVLIYTLHRLDQHYDHLEQKVDKTYDLVTSIIQGEGAYLDTISRGVASTSSQIIADFKENRKIVYKKLYDHYILKKNDTLK